MANVNVFVHAANADADGSSALLNKHTISVVRPSLTFHIFDFFSASAEQISTKFRQEARFQYPRHCLCFWPIGKPKRLPRPLIGSDIFDFISATAEGNSTKLYRRQIVNVLHLICLFGPIIIYRRSIPKRGTQVHDCGPLGLLFSA